jgi:hypothetical protein
MFGQPGASRNGPRAAVALCSIQGTGGADMHKHIITAFAAALAVTSAALAAEKTMNLSRNAKSGVDSLLAYSGRWDRNCKTLPVKITFTRQPANGTAWSVEADRVIPENTPASGDTGQCAGKPTQSKKIMYRSAPGFRGSDTVGYDSEGAGTVIHTTITVTVQ